MNKTPTFASMNLNESGLKKADEVTAIFTTALTQLEPLFCDPRCAALVRTKLEEACFFAKKSVALDPSNQSAPEVKP